MPFIVPLVAGVAEAASTAVGVASTVARVAATVVPRVGTALSRTGTLSRSAETVEKIAPKAAEKSAVGGKASLMLNTATTVPSLIPDTGAKAAVKAGPAVEAPATERAVPTALPTATPSAAWYERPAVPQGTYAAPTIAAARGPEVISSGVPIAPAARPDALVRNAEPATLAGPTTLASVNPLSAALFPPGGF